MASVPPILLPVRYIERHAGAQNWGGMVGNTQKWGGGIRLWPKAAQFCTPLNVFLAPSLSEPLSKWLACGKKENCHMWLAFGNFTYLPHVSH